MICSLFLLNSSCKKSTIDLTPIDYSYFPLKLKSWIIYDITKIKVDVLSAYYDTSRYQLKEIIDTTYLDETNHLNYRIERYIRTDSTKTWEIQDVWSECISDFSAQKVEENIRYVKLIFPVSLNDTWNGNMYNTLDEKAYKVSGLNKQETINGKKMNSVLTVLQDNQLNAIAKIYEFEKYEKNIGLVQKQSINISAYASSTIPIESRIRTAEFYYQNVISWGN